MFWKDAIIKSLVMFVLLHKTTERFPLTLNEYQESESIPLSFCEDFLRNNYSFERSCFDPYCWPRLSSCRLCTPGFEGEKCDKLIDPSKTLTVKIQLRLPFSVNDIEKTYNISAPIFISFFSLSGLRSLFGGLISWKYFIPLCTSIVDFRYHFTHFQ